MSQYTEGAVKTFTAGEALAAFRRVKLTASGTVSYADAGEDWVGTTEEAVSSGYHVAVRLRTAQGTRKLTAAGAITVNAVIYGADDGKVDDTADGAPVGVALEAATAAGDIIEVLSDTDATNSDFELGDGADIATGTTTGTKIATAAAQKLGFWGATPVVQQSHIADPAATAQALTDSTGGTAGTTLAAVSGSGADEGINNNLASLAARVAELQADVAANNTAIDSLLAQLATLGIQASS